VSDRPNRGAPLVAIVDDEVDIVTYLQTALEDEGLEVLTITEAESALKRLREARPDLICLDLLMPMLGGISLYAAMAVDPDLGSCPVVMMSGLEVRADLPALLERAGHLAPPAAFVEKPIDIVALVDVVHGLIGDCPAGAPASSGREGAIV